MRRLGPFILAQPPNPSDALRINLQDAAKEYTAQDVLVELLQNALDAIDEARFVRIAKAADLDPSADETIQGWNAAVAEALKSDFDEYSKWKPADELERAKLYKNWEDDSARRVKWWKILARHFECEHSVLERAAQTSGAGGAALTVTVRTDENSWWLEVEDNGCGIKDPKAVFCHTESTKRQRPDRPRRYGVRGSHGWGLTAVLAMSDTVEVLSKVSGASTGRAYAFSDYSAFRTDKVSKPTNKILTNATASRLSERLWKGGKDVTGTHVRVLLREVGETTHLERALRHFDAETFENVLRLYTPVGQVNDYVLNPAFHCIRKNDLKVSLKSISAGAVNTRPVPFDYFRIEGTSIPTLPYSALSSGPRHGVSVHVVHRSRGGGEYLLAAADVQAAELVRRLEAQLAQKLPAVVSDDGNTVQEIPRGFYLAHSGGLKTEIVLRVPKGNAGNFRGVVLSETARPSLGRKHIADQRTALAKCPVELEALYESLRKAVLVPKTAGPTTPAQAKWKREYVDHLIAGAASAPPRSASLRVATGDTSGEARVMLCFAELLGQGAFGMLRVLQAHLPDRYDFGFLYQATLSAASVPTHAVATQLHQASYANIIGAGEHNYCYYGVGEFKSHGESIFGDFNDTDPRKCSETIDLLVCWSFDHEAVGDHDWSVVKPGPHERLFKGQTHSWQPGGKRFQRGRPLCVVSLSELIDDEVKAGRLEAPQINWGQSLPKNYL